MLWLNIVTAIFGLGATLAAFGGETWTKGKAPVLKRITGRGWLAVTCILFAFIFGVTNEIIHAKMAVENKKLEDENKSQQKRIEKQVQQIAELQGQISAEVKQSTVTILEEAKNRRLVVKPNFDNNVYALVNKNDGVVKNLEFEIFAVLYADVREGNRSLLPGGIFTISSESPGVLFNVNREGSIFSIDTDEIYGFLKNKIKKIGDRIPSADSVTLDHYTCVRIEYDDEYGGHYKNFLSLRVFGDHTPRSKDMHDSKHYFDHCREDFDLHKQHDSHLLKFWHDNGRDLLVEKIVLSTQ